MWIVSNFIIPYFSSKNTRHKVSDIPQVVSDEILFVENWHTKRNVSPFFEAGGFPAITQLRNKIVIIYTEGEG